MSDAARIVEVGRGGLTPARLAEVDAIFFEASGRSFPSSPERTAFRERWLGRYLGGGTDVVLVALNAEDTVAGYLVGARILEGVRASDQMRLIARRRSSVCRARRCGGTLRR